jgi:hypothetical protein
MQYSEGASRASGAGSALYAKKRPSTRTIDPTRAIGSRSEPLSFLDWPIRAEHVTLEQNELALTPGGF